MTVVDSTTSSVQRTSIGEKLTPAEKHKDYYLQNGNVVIQVGDVLFKLDLAVLHAKSPVFRTIMPPVYGGRTRYIGFDDAHPFVLREVSAADFEHLLWMIYPLGDTSKRPTTVDAWLSVLKLTAKFQIDEVHSNAASALHTLPIDPIRKIAIWEEYRLDPTLLIPSYIALCERIEPLTLPMTMALGLKNFTKLAAARDIYHYNLGCLRCGRRIGHKEKQTLAHAAVVHVFLSPGISPIKTK